MDSLEKSIEFLLGSFGSNITQEVSGSQPSEARPIFDKPTKWQRRWAKEYLGSGVLGDTHHESDSEKIERLSELLEYWFRSNALREATKNLARPFVAHVLYPTETTPTTRLKFYSKDGLFVGDEEICSRRATSDEIREATDNYNSGKEKVIICGGYNNFKDMDRAINLVSPPLKFAVLEPLLRKDISQQFGGNYLSIADGDYFLLTPKGADKLRFLAFQFPGINSETKLRLQSSIYKVVGLGRKNGTTLGDRRLDKRVASMPFRLKGRYKYLSRFFLKSGEKDSLGLVVNWKELQKAYFFMDFVMLQTKIAGSVATDTMLIKIFKRHLLLTFVPMQF